LDTQSSLMLLGVRYYGAGVGRLSSLDPITKGLNWYQYPTSPTKSIDPTGLQVERCPKCGGIAYGGYCPNCGPPGPPSEPVPIPPPDEQNPTLIGYGRFCSPKRGEFINEEYCVGKVKSGRMTPAECQKCMKPKNEPIDDLDACCMEHDKCYRCHQANVITIYLSLHCGTGPLRKPCDDPMCECLKNVKCNKYRPGSNEYHECIKFRNKAIGLFCYWHRRPRIPPLW